MIDGESKSESNFVPWRRRNQTYGESEISVRHGGFIVPVTEEFGNGYVNAKESTDFTMSIVPPGVSKNFIDPLKYLRKF